jgi:hypothetical protein
MKSFWLLRTALLFASVPTFAQQPTTSSNHSGEVFPWKRHSRNPVFPWGEAGAWDDGAVWFTTVEKSNGRYYMWYEGYGGGTARTEAYGGGGRSQVGMATLDAPYSFVKPPEAGIKSQ